MRVINAYGPQELESEKENIFQFYQDFEKEILQAKLSNCKILIQLDANAKLGSDVIKGDPNKISNNGGLLLELIRRQNLAVLNANDLCKGIITRHRTTVLGEEKSVLDYIIVCDFLLSYLEKMLVDENRMFVLTKYGKRS